MRRSNLLEGKSVNLRVVEKEELPLLAEWFSTPEVLGEFNPLRQVSTDVRNVGSQRVLEKTGFKREGTLRRFFFIRGEWRDVYVYSILREEWKEPKILTREKAESQ